MVRRLATLTEPDLHVAIGPLAGLEHRPRGAAFVRAERIQYAMVAVMANHVEVHIIHDLFGGPGRQLLEEGPGAPHVERILLDAPGDEHHGAPVGPLRGRLDQRLRQAEQRQDARRVVVCAEHHAIALGPEMAEVVHVRAHHHHLVCEVTGAGDGADQIREVVRHTAFWIFVTVAHMTPARDLTGVHGIAPGGEGLVEGVGRRARERRCARREADTLELLADPVARRAEAGRAEFSAAPGGLREGADHPLRESQAERIVGAVEGRRREVGHLVGIGRVLADPRAASAARAATARVGVGLGCAAASRCEHQSTGEKCETKTVFRGSNRTHRDSRGCVSSAYRTNGRLVSMHRRSL